MLQCPGTKNKREEHGGQWLFSDLQLLPSSYLTPFLCWCKMNEAHVLFLGRDELFSVEYKYKREDPLMGSRMESGIALSAEHCVLGHLLCCKSRFISSDTALPLPRICL